MVTRASDVKPLATVLTLSCDGCGYEVFQEVTTAEVSFITECPSEECKKNNKKGSLHLQTRACKFYKTQEVRLQEMTDQVPMGHIPRTLNVLLYESLARQVTAGNIVTITGIFLPIPYSGFQGMRAGKSYSIDYKLICE